MNPALLQKGSNSFRTDSEIKDHEGRAETAEADRQTNEWMDGWTSTQILNGGFNIIPHIFLCGGV